MLVLNLQYFFVHMLVHNKQFISQYARYEHKIIVTNSFGENQNRCFFSRYFFENRGDNI